MESSRRGSTQFSHANMALRVSDMYFLCHREVGILVYMIHPEFPKGVAEENNSVFSNTYGIVSV